MLTTIVTANRDTAQVLFLLAAIVLMVVAVVKLMARDIEGGLGWAALSAVALGLLFL